MVSSSNTALLVIDVQRGLFEKSTPIYQAEQLLENICALIERAHGAGTPVFYVQHAGEKILVEGSDEWRFHPRLQPLESDMIVSKTHGSAFEATILKSELEKRGVRRLVVTGLVTHGCVRATCLDAFKLGYEVILVQDGHSNYHKKAAHVIEEWNRKLSQGGAILKPTQEIGFLVSK